MCILYRLFSLVVLFCTSAFLSLLGLIGADKQSEFLLASQSIGLIMYSLLERALGINTSCSWSLYSWWLLIWKTYFLVMQFFCIAKLTVLLLQMQSLPMWDLFLFILRECILSDFIKLISWELIPWANSLIWNYRNKHKLKFWKLLVCHKVGIGLRETLALSYLV